jgi:hypothetical protein
MPLPHPAPPLHVGDLLTTAQAAAVLGVATQYLVRLRREGVGPTYSQLSPRKVLNAAADLRAWISDHVVEREMA